MPSANSERTGLLQRVGSLYAYRLIDKGIRVSLPLLLFHQRLRGLALQPPVPSPARSKSSQQSPRSGLRMRHRKPSAESEHSFGTDLPSIAGGNLGGYDPVGAAADGKLPAASA